MHPPAWGWGRDSSPEVTAAPSWLWRSGDIGQGSHRGGISRRRHHGHSPGTRGRHRARSPRHHQPSQDGRQPWLCSTPSCRERAPGPEQPFPCLPAGRPRGSCKELKGLCQQQGSPRGSAGPGPPRCERGRSLWGCSAGAGGALSLLSLLQPLEVRQVQAANNLLKPDVLAQSCHEEFQGAPALGGPAPRSLPFRRGGETRPGAARGGALPPDPAAAPCSPGHPERGCTDFQPFARKSPSKKKKTPPLSPRDSGTSSQHRDAGPGGKAAGEQRGTAHPERQLLDQAPALSRGHSQWEQHKVGPRGRPWTLFFHLRYCLTS